MTARRSIPGGAWPARGGRRLGTVALAAVLALVSASTLNADSASVGASVQVLAIQLDLSVVPATARAGERVKAEATVTNAGGSRVSSIGVSVRVDAAAVSVKGPATFKVANLQPGKSATGSWTLCAAQPGNYVVLARASVAGVSVESPARLLTVTGQSKKTC